MNFTAASKDIELYVTLEGMRAYSVDLRQRVLAAVDRGIPRQEVVVTFGVSLATIKRWLVQRRKTADLTPTAPPGRHRSITREQHAALSAQLENNSDATLEQHTRVWKATHGTDVSRWTLARAIRRLGWTRNKRRWVPPNATSKLGLPIERASSGGLRTTS
jgi:transposase